MKKDDHDSAPGRGDEAFAPDELRRISDEIASEFPTPRLGTELVLLEVDPQRAHAYWNIDLEDFRDAKLDSGSDAPALILRMHDITGVDFDGTNAVQTFDVEIQGLQGQWYVDLWQQGRTYVADIGFLRSDRSLAFLARSNEVTTPSAGPSPLDNASALDFIAVALSRELAAEAPAAASAPKLAILSRKITGDIKRRLIENDYPKQDGPGIAVAETTTGVEAPWPEPPDLAEDQPIVREKIEAFYKAMTAPESAITDAETRMEHELEGKPDAPSNANPPEPVPLPLESYVNLSSFENNRSAVELEINTELHIYGRAKPGSDLTLFGQKVPLRPDGSFSIRKPLPQGAVVLPLLFSSNGDST